MNSLRCPRKELFSGIERLWQGYKGDKMKTQGHGNTGSTHTRSLVLAEIIGTGVIQLPISVGPTPAVALLEVLSDPFKVLIHSFIHTEGTEVRANELIARKKNLCAWCVPNTLRTRNQWHH